MTIDRDSQQPTPSAPSGLDAVAEQSMPAGTEFIADARMLLQGTFLRAGDSLVITGPDGAQHTVVGYFAAGAAPLLVAPGGVVLDAATIATLTQGGWPDGVQLAGPLDGLATDPDLGPPIGRVMPGSGAVTVRGSDGVVRTVQPGGALYAGDTIETGGTGSVLEFGDGSTLQLGADATLVLESFSYDRDSGSGSLTATILEGTFEFVGSSSDMFATLKTPVAMMEIHGGDVVGEVLASGQTTMIYQNGAVDVARSDGTPVAEPSAAGETVIIPVTGDQPPQVLDSPPPDVAERLQDTLPPVPEPEPPAVRTVGVTASQGTTETGGSLASADSLDDPVNSGTNPDAPGAPAEPGTQGAAGSGGGDGSQAGTGGEGGTPTTGEVSNIVGVSSNQAPLIDAQSFSVLENSPLGTSVGSVVAVDADTIGDPLDYVITGGSGADYFEIDAASGEITVSDPTVLDFETSPSFTLEVAVDDGIAPQASATVTINLADANDPPVVTSGAVPSIEENQTAVIDLTASDQDGDVPTFSIVGGADQALFQLAGNQLQFLAGPDFEVPGDNNGDNVYEITVRADDGNGGTADQAVQVTVTNVNDTAPVITSGAAFSLDENTTAVGTVTATDADVPADTLTFSIAGTGADDALFQIDGSTGALSFASAPDFENPQDSGGDNVYDVDVQVSDGSLTDTQSVAVTVQDVGALVFSSGSSFSVDENTTAVGTVVAAAEDPITYSISGGADAGRFQIDGSTGALSFASAPDFENPQDSGTDNVFDVRVEADAGPSGAITQDIQVTVDAVNDNDPVITSGAAFSLDENTTAVGTVTATDADVPADTLTFSIAGTGADDALFQIDGSTGALSFASAPDFENPQDSGTDNVYDVDVQVSDGSRTDTQSVAVTVDAVNDNDPAITSGAAFSLDENTTAVGTVTATDADVPADTLTFSIVGGADQALFQLAGNQLQFVASPDFEVPGDANGDNVYELTLRADDGNGGTSDQALQVTVTNVNDNAPVFTSPVTANADENQTLAQVLSASDPDGGTITFSVVGGADQGLFQVVGNELRFIASQDFENPSDAGTDGTYDVNLQASDGANSSGVQSVAITLQDVNDPPVGGPDGGGAFTTDEDTAFTTGDVLTNDTDQDVPADTLSVLALNTTGTAGLVTDNGNGTFDYDPDGQFEFLAVGESATDTFGYTVSDGNGGTDTATVTVTVNGINDGPTAVADNGFSTDEDTAVSAGNVLTNDTDPDTSDVLTVSAVRDSGGAGQTFGVAFANVSGALVTLNAGGTYNYDPNGQFENLAVGESATDTFSYTVSDGHGGTDTATVTVTVNGANDAPTADDDAVAANEDGGAADVTATLLAGDTDPDTSDTLVVSAVDTTGTTGAVVLNAGVVTYDPNGQFESLVAGESTTDTFKYTLSDGNGGTDTATVTVTVNGANDGPTADDDAVAASEDDGAANVTATLLAGDTDPDASDTLVVSAVDPTGTTGAVVLNAGTVTYNPNGQFESLAAGESTTDTFKYTVSDGNGGTDTATVTVTVNGANDGPTADDDAVVANEDDGAADVTATLLAGDTDPDTSDTLVVSAVDTTGTTGAVVLNAGVVTYNPNGQFESLAAGESTTDTFKYTVSDGNGGTDTATVTVTVNGANDAPTADDDAVVANEDDGAADVTATLLAGDTDPDASDTLVVSAVDPTGTTGAVVLNAGVVTYNPNGQFESLAVGESTTDTFKYTLSDGNGGTDTATVTVTVNGANDLPTATADTINGTFVQAFTIGVGSGVLANDTDVDTSDMLTVSAVRDSGGGAHTVGAQFANVSGGLLTLNGNGSFSYDPTPLGATTTVTDTFSYTVSDGHGGTDTATVTLTLLPNAPPVATDNDYTGTPTDQDTVFGAGLNVITDALADDDPDGDNANLFVASNTNSVQGATVTVNANGTFTYDPDTALDFLGVGESTTDTFTYTLQDELGGQAVGTVSVKVTGVNDAPTADDDAVVANEDGVAADVTATLLAGDTDPDASDTLVVSAVDTTGTTGAVVLNAGTVTYNPNGQFESLAVGESTTDTFKYTVSDGNGGTDTATVTVTVNGANDAPTADDDAVVANEDGVAADVTATLLAGDTDPDASDTLVVSAVDTTGTTGAVVLNAGTVTYNPNASFESLAAGESTTDTFKYTVSDGNGGTDTATVTVTVNGANDAPTADDDAVVANEDGGAADVTATLLAGDTDPDASDTLVVSAVDTTGTTGAVVLNAGTVTYNPNGQFESLAAGESTTDTFKYTLSDGNGGTDTATVTVTVNGANDGPTADDDAVAASEDGGAADVTATLLAGDTDPDASDTLVVSAVDTTGTTGAVVLNAGVVTYNPNASFESLAAGESTTDTFKYTVSDGNGGTDTATVTVTVNGANDAPTADDDAVVANEDGVAADVTATLLAGDTDPDASDTLVVSAVDTTGTTGAVVLNAGVVTYNPNASFESLAAGESTTDTFKYTLSDGNGGTDTATVTVTVTGQNDPVTAVDDTLLGVNEDDATATTTGNVLTNDTDPDASDTLSVVAGVGGSPVGLVVNNGNGTFDYDPNGQFESLTVGETTTDSFTYQVTDGNGSTDTGTVTVTVTGQNDPVTAVDDARDVGNLSTAVVDVVANDTDPDIDGSGLDDTLTVVSVAGTSIGVGDTVDVTSGALNSTTPNQAFVTLNADGTLTYDPNGEFDGLVPPATTTDTFTYQVSDGNGSTDTATVTMTVTTNPPPVAGADSGVGFEGTEDVAFTTGDVLANDVDTSTPPEPISVVAGVGGSPVGLVVNNGNGTFDYDPNGQFESLAAGETTTDSFTYQVTDGTSNDTGTVTIKLTGVNDGPTADDDAVAASEDDGAADVTATLLAGDTDPDASDTLVVSAVDPTGTTGAVVLNAGTVTYNPNGQFESLAVGESTTDTFKYTVSDGNGGTDTATVTVTVNGANDAPTADDDAVAASEDDGAADVTATLLAGDTDPDASDTLVVSAVDTTGTTGAVVLNAGTVTYNPNGQFESLAAGESTTDTFKYTVSDGNGGTDTATVTVTVNGANDAPTADDDAVVANEDGGAADVTATLLAGDTDPDASDTLVVSAVDTTGTTGAVVLNAGTVTYNPNGQFESLAAGESTTDTFKYTLSDGNGGTDTATVTVTVNGANDAPTADDDAVVANEDGGAADVTATLLAGDTDPDASDTLVVSAVDTTGTTGAVVLNAGVVTYNPNASFESLAAGESTTDTFKYTVSDGNGGTDTATVTVTVNGANDAPTADDDAVVANEDGVAADVTATLLAGDTDPDASDTLVVSAVDTTGTTGAVVLNAGVVTYNPNASFESLAAGESTTDTFKYTLSDGNGGTDTATVTVTVTGQNDPVTAVDDTLLGVNEDDATATTTGNVLTNDTDPDASDTLSVVAGVGGSPVGLVVNNGNGTFDYDPNGQFESLTVGETTTDSFTYQVTDGNGSTDTGTVTVTVTGQNDPVTAVDDARDVGNLSTAVVDVVANDTDPDIDGSGLDDTLTVVSVAGTSIGVGDTVDVTSGALNSTTPNQAFVTLNADGTLTYDPNGEFDGLVPPATTTDTFTYQVSDGNGSTDTATVTMTVTTNPPPVAGADSGVGFEGTEDVAFTTGDVLANDVDTSTPPEPISVVAGVGGSPVGLVVNNGNGTFDYDPNGQFESLAAGETTTDSFTYQVTDGTSNDTGTVTIKLTGVNDGPTADDDAVAASEDDGAADVTATLLAGDTDPDASDTLVVSAVDTTGTTGAVVLNAGTVTYNPNGQFESLAAGESTTDTFKYTVSDGNGGTDTATVTVTVNGANDAPTADDDAVVANEDGVAADVTATLLAGDADPDASDTLVVSAVDTTGTTGAVVLNAGTVTYNPNGQFESLAAGESTTDTFKYTLSDGNGGTDTATVTVTVNGANDAPTADDDAVVANEDGGAADVTATLLAGDTDPDASDTLVVSAVDTTGTTGAVVLNAGTVTYNPNGQFESLAAGESTTDTFKYTVSDGNGGTDTATVTVTVNGANDAPTADDDAVVANEDDGAADVTATLLAGDTDPDASDTLVVSAVDTTGTTGAVVLNAGVVTYNPNGQFESLAAGESTTDTFKYTLSDGNGGTDTATVTVTVNGANDAPTADDDAVVANEDGGAADVTATLLAGDTDPDTSDTLVVSAVDPTGTTGAVVLNAGVVTYNPNASFESLAAGESTTDTFKYTVSDGNGGTDTATVTVTVTGQNDPVTAVDDTLLGVNEDDATATTTGNVLTNDTDPDASDTLSVVAGVGGSPVGLVVNNGNGTFDYDPNGQFESLTVGETTTDSFTYQVTDGNGSTDTGTVTVTVTGQNDPVTAVDDARDVGNLSTAVVDVVANDTDPDIDGSGLDDTLTVVSVAGTSIGVGDTVDVTTGALNSTTPNQAFVTLNADGTLTYDPNGEFDGLVPPATTTDTFTYQVSDGNGSTDTATVTMTVTTNPPPVAGADSGVGFEGTEDVAFTTGDVLANDVDTSTPPEPISVVAGVGGSPVGLVVNNGNGTFDYDPNGQFESLAAGETTTDSFTYQVTDGTSNDTGTVTIKLTGVNDGPTADDDAVAASEDDGAADVTATLLAGDTDPDASDTLVVSAVDTTGTTGAVVLNAGTVTYNPNGQFESLAAGESTTDTFKYTVSDGNGGTDTATVTVTVNGANDGPTADDDAVAASEDDGAADVTATLLAGDADPDASDTLVVSAVDTTGTTGAVVLNAGTVTYNPNGQFESLAAGESTTDTFKYTVSDGNGGTDTATVTVTVNGANDAPTADDDAVVANEDGGAADVTATLLAGDTDPDTSDTLVVSAVDTTGTTGAVVLNAGVVTYNPNASFESLAAGESTTDTFKYTLSDGNGGTDTATVTVTVNGANDGPTADDDAVVANEDGGAADVTATLLAGDTDPDASDTLVVSAVDTTGTTGAVVLNAGTVTYNPNGQFESLAAGESTTDTFKYTLSDGNGGTDTATVTVTVNGANDAPTADDDAVVANEDGGAADVTATLLAGDTDPDASDTLVVSAVDTTGTTGAVVLNAGVVTYNPNASFESLAAGESTTDTFKYTVSDGNGGTDTATVTVTVTGQNDAPTADDDAVVANEDGGAADVTATLLAGDTDPDASDTLVVSAVDTTGTTGAVVLNAGVVTYNPNASFESLAAGESTTDTFKYTVSDGDGGTDTATVTVTVTGQNDGPTADADGVAVAEDDGVTDVTATLLAGDTDPDTNDTLTVSAVDTTGTTGAVVLNAGTVTYSPDGKFESLAPGETTTDTFGYTITDGHGGTDTATVTVTVTGQNDAPTADDDAVVANEDGVAADVTATLLAGDTDPDTSDTLLVSAVNTTGTTGTVVLNAGVVTYNPDGQFESLAAGETTTDTFKYTVSDGNGGTDTATVTVTVTGQNDAPTGVNDTGTVDDDKTLNRNAAQGVLANDTDPDTNDVLTVTEVNGAGGNVNAAVDGNNGGQFTIAADGSYLFDPSAGTAIHPAVNSSELTSVTYTLEDPSGETSTATIEIEVFNPNAPPIANDDAVTVGEDGPALNGDLFADNGSGIDSDPSDPITVTVVAGNSNTGAPQHTLPSGALVDVSNTADDGSFSYDPNGQFNGLAVGATATDTFTYTLSDGRIPEGTDTATVTVTITGANDAPQIGGFGDGAINDKQTVSPFASVTITDADVTPTADSQTVTVTLDDAGKGIFTSASLTASGFTNQGGGAYRFLGTATQAQTAIRQLVYDPTENRVAPGSTETTTFTVAVNDGTANVSDPTTDVVVTSVNDAPTVSNLSGGGPSGASGTAVSFDVGTPATVVDVDSTNFNTGRIFFDRTGGSATADTNFSVDGTTVKSGGNATIAAGESITVSGTAIGTVGNASNNGQGGNDLIITFNSSATPARVTTLLHNLKVTGTSTGTHNFEVTVDDGDGGTSSVSSVTFTVASGGGGNLPMTIDLQDLDGTNGLILLGTEGLPDAVNPGGNAGRALAAGDFNGDGLGDLVVGEPFNDPGSIAALFNNGAVQVLYGTTNVTGLTGAATGFNLQSLDGVQDSNSDGQADGYSLNGTAERAQLGASVGGGDVDGDGNDDVLAGESNLIADSDFHGVFGDGGVQDLAVGDLDGQNGFSVQGGNTNGDTALATGNVNGDTRADIAFGVREADVSGRTNSGQVALVLGAATPAPPGTSPLDGIDVSADASVYRFFGAAGSFAGHSVSMGDIDGDGLDDLVIGAPGGDGSSGKVYVVFGHALQAAATEAGSNINTPNSLPNVFTTGLDLTVFDGNDGAAGTDNDLNNDGTDEGFVLNGTGFDQAGKAVALANVDGDSSSRADLVIGAPGFPGYSAGQVYVVRGKASGFDDVNLASVSGSAGFTISDTAYGAGAGLAVASAGFMNGDAFEDIIIGAPGHTDAVGRAYIVFGSASPSDVNLTAMAAGEGITITNSASFTQAPRTGDAVTGVGDFNGDGFDDVALGAPEVDTVNGFRSGEAYIFFGGPTGTVHLGPGDDTYVDGDGPETIVGEAGDDTILGAGGDDIVVGGLGNDHLDGGAGADTLRGGAGNDTLAYDPADMVADGGSGMDTLVLSGQQSLDFTALAAGRIVGIERIDLHAGAHDLKLDMRDILDLTDGAVVRLDGRATPLANALVVDGEGDDSLVTGGWGAGHTGAAGSVTLDGVAYLHYTNGTANLLVDPDIAHTVVA